MSTARACSIESNYEHPRQGYMEGQKPRWHSSTESLVLHQQGIWPRPSLRDLAGHLTMRTFQRFQGR